MHVATGLYIKEWGFRDDCTECLLSVSLYYRFDWRTEIKIPWLSGIIKHDYTIYTNYIYSLIVQTDDDMID